MGFYEEQQFFIVFVESRLCSDGGNKTKTHASVLTFALIPPSFPPLRLTYNQQ